MTTRTSTTIGQQILVRGDNQDINNYRQPILVRGDDQDINSYRQQILVRGDNQDINSCRTLDYKYSNVRKGD